MSNQKQSLSPNLKSLLKPKITSLKSIIISFLNNIYTELSNRSGRLLNAFIFQEFIQLPMIISEKLFSYLTYSDKSPLSIVNFSNGIFNLLYSSIEDKISIVFQIYDFDKDNMIHKNDVLLLLKYFHLIENTSDSIWKIDSIVNNFFDNENNTMDKLNYITKCLNTNSDIALLMIIFINKYLILFKRAELKLFRKLISYNGGVHNGCDEDIKHKYKNIRLLPHSQYLIDYLISIKFYEPKDRSVDCDESGDSIFLSDSEENKELKELDSFEKDINTVFNNVKNEHLFKFDKTLSPSKSFTLCPLNKNKDNTSKSKVHLNIPDESNSFIHTTNSMKKIPVQNVKKLIVPCFLNSSYQEDSALSNTPSVNGKSNNSNNNFASSVNKSFISTNFQSINISNTITSSVGDKDNASPKHQIQHSRSKNNNFQLLKSSTTYLPNMNEDTQQSKTFVSKQDSYYKLNYPKQDINFKYQVLYLYKYKNEIKTNVQVKYMLVNKYIFYFKKKKNNSSYKFIHFIPIFGIFPIIVKLNRRLTKITFTSSVYNHVKYKSFIGDSNLNDIETFIDKMNTLNNYTPITDDFDLQQEIGKGKFGHVLLARSLKTTIFNSKNGNYLNTLSNPFFAVKIIKKNIVCEEEYKINRWESSIFSTLINVYHPNIIRCYKKYETIDRLLFVYDFIEGNDLKTYIKKNADLKRNINILKLSIEILNGLSYLHNMGIIHRDIKTTNILVDTAHSNKIIILDFGLSKVMGFRETTNDPYGSLCFKAPELINHYSYHFAVDVWAFGITVYYMLFKQLPFEKGTKNDVKLSIIKDTISYPVNDFRFGENEWNEVVLAMVKECLCRDVKKRTPSEELFKKYSKILENKG